MDFQRLVNEGHKIGIAVILDGVYNHVDKEFGLSIFSETITNGEAFGGKKT